MRLYDDVYSTFAYIVALNCHHMAGYINVLPFFVIGSQHDHHVCHNSDIWHPPTETHVVQGEFYWQSSDLSVRCNMLMFLHYKICVVNLPPTAVGVSPLSYACPSSTTGYRLRFIKSWLFVFLMCVCVCVCLCVCVHVNVYGCWTDRVPDTVNRECMLCIHAERRSKSGYSGTARWIFWIKYFSAASTTLQVYPNPFCMHSLQLLQLFHY